MAAVLLFVVSCSAQIIGAPHYVKLNYTPSQSLGVTSYNIYRSLTSGGPYTKIANTTSTSTYTDNAVTACTTYYYVLTAVDAQSNESGYSMEVKAVIPGTCKPQPPTNISAVVDGLVTPAVVQN